jgi:c-di-GMP-binding flagellar brake protein YcgR
MSTPHPPARRIIELRKHPRIFTPSGALFSFKRLVIPIQFQENTEGEGTLIDLSLGGCRLTSDVPLEIGEQYRLILQVSSDRRPIPVEAAVVRWTQDKTYGLKFTALQSDDESRLQELLLEIRHPAP